MDNRNINVGYIKECLNKKITNSLLNGDVDLIDDNINNFITIISESEILKTEYDIFESLLNNRITSDVVASRFIDKTISLMENYTIEEINKEHEKLNNINVEGVSLDESRSNIINDIINIIYESNKSNNFVDINLLYESYTNILDYITKEKTPKNTNNNININETVLNIALDKFNKKYSNLNENDINILKKITTSNYKEKIILFEELKNNNIKILSETLALDKDQNNIDKYNKAIEKINNITISESNIDNEIIKQYELSKGLNE